MKRSEMIKKIQESLKHRSLGAGECPQFVAEDVLKTMEEAGMLPPTTKLSHIDAYDNAWDPE